MYVWLVKRDTAYNLEPENRKKKYHNIGIFKITNLKKSLTLFPSP